MGPPDSVLKTGIRGDGTPYSDNAVEEIYSRILSICRASGLALQDSEDIAQDVWAWLLRTECPRAALTAPWLAAVVHNHVLRHRRQNGKLRAREGIPLEAIPEPGVALDTSRLEANDFLDRVAAVLPVTERNLLVLIRKGYTLARAAELLRIPRGSRAYYGGRLVRLAREGIRDRLASADPTARRRPSHSP